nr:nucleoside recognition domain-containing protein [uncultured Enterobacter sp.]
MDIIAVIMAAGKASIDVVLYTLVPIMVVMLVIMKFLEERGVLDVIVRMTSPLLKPFGMTGMSIFALIQLNFVSFAAPLASLAIMEKRGASDRHLAATLAMVFAMGQGNVFYPLTPFGLHWGQALAISVLGGLAAATVTYHLTGRRLSQTSLSNEDETAPEKKSRAGLIAIINGAGSDAIRLSLGSLPMLILSLVVVGLLREAGAIDALTRWLTPVMTSVGLSPAYVLPALTKTLAGGTAYFGVVSELVQKGVISVQQINASAGFMIQTLDLPGLGIFLGLSPRFARLFRFALPGALVGVFLRTLIHTLIN